MIKHTIFDQDCLILSSFSRLAPIFPLFKPEACASIPEDSLRGHQSHLFVCPSSVTTLTNVLFLSAFVLLLITLNSRLGADGQT